MRFYDLEDWFDNLLDRTPWWAWLLVLAAVAGIGWLGKWAGWWA